jgi:hypothetical protein
MAMDRALCELRDRRDRAARETLAFAGWRCSRTSVARAIEAMLANSHLSVPALGWLLRQIDALQAASDKEDAMTRVLDLSFAIDAYFRAQAAGSVVIPFPALSSSIAIDASDTP